MIGTYMILSSVRMENSWMIVLIIMSYMFNIISKPIIMNIWNGKIEEWECDIDNYELEEYFEEYFDGYYHILFQDNCEKLYSEIL